MNQRIVPDHLLQPKIERHASCDITSVLQLAQGSMPDAAPDGAEKRRATNHHCDTPAAGWESEGVGRMDATAWRACGDTVGRGLQSDKAFNATTPKRESTKRA